MPTTLVINEPISTPVAFYRGVDILWPFAYQDSAGVAVSMAGGTLDCKWYVDGTEVVNSSAVAIKFTTAWISQVGGTFRLTLARSINTKASSEIPNVMDWELGFTDASNFRRVLWQSKLTVRP